MRYHYEKPEIYLSMYGEHYLCNHPAYNSCTLFKMDGKGLAVIQQRYDSGTKVTYWTELDPWLIDDIYLNPKFQEYFEEKAEKDTDGIYPTVTIRQIMWSLKMKPLQKQRWETVFDHSPI